jgi:hypothetical protein
MPSQAPWGKTRISKEHVRNTLGKRFLRRDDLNSLQ